MPGWRKKVSPHTTVITPPAARTRASETPQDGITFRTPPRRAHDPPDHCSTTRSQSEEPPLARRPRQATIGFPALSTVSESGKATEYPGSARLPDAVQDEPLHVYSVRYRGGMVELYVLTTSGLAETTAI